MVDRLRRLFFSDLVHSPLTILSKICGYAEPKEKEDYFDSYESAYTLISESLPFLEDEIERLNIDATGKTNLEVVKEIYKSSRKTG